MRKLSKTLLSLLLIAAMLASFVVLPAAAEEPAAEQPTEAVQAAETQADDAEKSNYELSIVMLDCGRKYFSVDSIKQLIDNAAAAGFNNVMLAVGNDGMRFLLDDMSLTVNGTTYSSEKVAAAIHTGNEAYYNFTTDELTESEMDEIIAYAKTKGLGIIPVINTPGHMDAILDAAEELTGKTCSYSGSARTIDVTNSTAVAFTQALLQKYVDYFAGKGCRYFNFGADEYANDRYTSGSMGFGSLQSSGKYGYFIKYVNEQNNMRISTGMLNDLLADATARVQPPTDKGKRLKIYYITQASTKPPTFVCFCNNKELFHFSYQRYLENQIRSTFGLEGTPVRMVIRERGE